ncbi:DUF1176 domain-containing protein [Alcaligenes sp. SDU_A2]|uniref:DUF1176 domain-containing protein n=1 Tax=Alcaligenes sp. SDU_A2 TaxID=3136634 RepID=UPI00311DD8E5
MKRQKRSCSTFLSVPASCVLLAMSMGSAAAQSAAATFSHKDWDLICDNTLTCRAAGYAKDGVDKGATVLLTRQAGRDTPVMNRVMLAHYDDGAGQRASPPDLLIAGRTAGPLAFAGDDSWQMNDAQAARFLAALKKDAPVSFRENGSDFSVSGAGSSAVLLKMDDVQGRVNTPGAILRKGANKESSVKMPVAAPVIHRAAVTDKALRPMTTQEAAVLRAPILRVLAADQDQVCTEDRLAEPWEVAQLNDNTLLVSAPCWLAAYNGGSAYFVINKHMRSAPVLVSDSGNDYENGKISSAMKGRGLGDCWSHQEWVWNGAEFVESARGDTGRCMAIRAGGAWDIPEYVSQVREP